DKRTKDVKKIRKLLWDSGQDIPVWTETYHEDRNENEAITVEKEPQEMESDTVEVQQIFICPAKEKTEIETATEETTARTTTITVLDGTFRLELSDKKTDFRCIKMDFVDRELNIGMGSCLEIKKRDGFYITNAWKGKKYTTIDALIKDELKESFKDFYDKKQHKKRGKEAWAAFVSEGGLQLFLDFANEIIDDEFLNSPFNEIYG
ncbi:MAG: hypothetical protein LBC89_00500, partial [Bacteroidales bacterium]|nr:hypothetical protein [Bacteroidales bacterium]